MSQDQPRFLLGSKRPDLSSQRMGTFLQGNRACSGHQGGPRKSSIWHLRAPTRAALSLEAALSPRMPETVATHIFPSSSQSGEGREDHGRGQDKEKTTCDHIEDASGIPNASTFAGVGEGKYINFNMTPWVPMSRKWGYLSSSPQTRVAQMRKILIPKGHSINKLPSKNSS